MAQYKVNKRFRLLDNVNVPDVGPIQEIGEIIDIKVKRADQVIKTLGSSFLERVEKQEDDQEVDEVIEEVTEDIENVEETD